MNLNSFELEIKDDGNSEECPEYYIKLKIDGEEFLTQIDEDFNAVYFEDLKLSSEESGGYLIFTCSCGIADCGGWDYVKVKHIDQKVIWDFSYGEAFHFEFSKADYIKEILKIDTKIDNEGIRIEPQDIVNPE